MQNGIPISQTEPEIEFNNWSYLTELLNASWFKLLIKFKVKDTYRICKVIKQGKLIAVAYTLRTY